MKLKLYLNNDQSITKQYDEPVSIETIVKEVQNEVPYRIVSARFNRKVKRLNTVLTRSGTLELLDIRDPGARMSYQASLLLLFVKAVHDVAGPGVKVYVNNSLSKGLYTTLKKTELTDAFIEAVEERMRKLQREALPIHERTVLRDELMDGSIDPIPESLRSNLAYTPELKVMHLYSIEDEEWAFSSVLVPDTGYIDLFEVRKYRRGVLVRFPHPTSPGEVLPFEEQKVLYDAFSEERRWCKITGCHLASDLNRMILEEKEKELVFMNEALHEHKIASIAAQIVEQKKRVILIAGPSSSGKTTFANRLCIQLRVAGLNPLYIGTDNYYVGRANMPIGEDGKPDFEGIEALDLDLMNHDIQALLNGETVDLPVYNFKDGVKEFGKRILSIEANAPIVIEGLHGLNPKLSEHFEEADKFRIYISPLTQLNIDSMNRIPTTDARMLRRIVRDARFRDYSAAQTIEIWPRVNRGEDRNIFPYNIYADAFFNSQCIYELAVLKKYAKPLLEKITDDQPEYTEAQRLLNLLEYFVTMEDDEVIPNNSILREFIGGSVIV
ncbi:MAG: hypothetical protein IJ225_02495 [Solobacterium sp.]|nr:hypothetical protein [Solobacterium sp.]